MKIEYFAKDNPKEWIEYLAQQFGTRVVDNTFNISSELGEGFMKQVYLFEGFTLTYLHFKLTQQVELIRHSVKNANLFPIMFFGQEEPLELNIEGKKKQIGYNTSNGIFMPSPQIESRWKLPANMDEYQITLTVDKKWFTSLFALPHDNYLKQVLESNKPFYIFESIQSSMRHLINDIHQVINSNNNFQYFTIHQKAIELFNLFLMQLEYRNTENISISSINKLDVQRVFNVRKTILDNLNSPPQLKSLATDSGMSISKLQRCFRQVFGKSISQYALSEKMQMAKQMLNTKKYTISEVGYDLGYTNLSHFSKAFYNEFGVNPKTHLSSLINS